MVSIAKSSGDGNMLFPDGTNILTVPSDLAACLDQAYRILHWQENLPEDEMPPKWMWHLDWELEGHFESVKRKRDARYNSEPEESDAEMDWEDNIYASRFSD